MKIKITILALLFAFITNAQVLLNENFGGENFPPTGWTLESVGAWDTTWFNVPNSDIGAAVYWDNTINQDERLISPSLNLTTYSTAYLAFQPRMFYLPMIEDDLGDFFVKISTDNGVNWITLWDDSQFDFNSPGNTQTINLDISNYTGANMEQVKIMFQFTSIVNDLDYLFYVQFYSVYLDSCPRPAILSQSPAITWSLPSTFEGTVDIEYGPVGFEQFSGTTVSGITGNSFTLPNMNCQDYQYFIRGNCGGTSSVWSNRTSRRLINSVFASTQLSETTAEISWTGFGDNFILEYGPLGFTSGSGTIITNITEASYQLTNLSPCTGYTVRVKASCDESSNWVSRDFTSSSENMVNLVALPFTETFDSPNTLCEIGYSSGITGNVIENDALKVVSFMGVYSRKMALVAGNQYSISIDARKNSTAFNTTGTILIENRNNFTISENIFNIDSPTTEFNNFTTTFTAPESGTYQIFFSSNSNTPEDAMFYDNLTVTTVLSNQEFYESNISFSPNPTASHITFLQEVSNLEVFDISGKKVKTFQSLSTSFNLSDLTKGIYFLKGKTTEGVNFTEKLIKN